MLSAMKHVHNHFSLLTAHLYSYYPGLPYAVLSLKEEERQQVYLHSSTPFVFRDNSLIPALGSFLTWETRCFLCTCRTAYLYSHTEVSLLHYRSCHVITVNVMKPWNAIKLHEEHMRKEIQLFFQIK